MNPLLFANLGQQRRLLESRTAYPVARLAVNAAFGLAVAAGIVGGLFWVKVLGGIVATSIALLPEQTVFLEWAGLGLGGLAYLAGLYVAWAAAHAFFDVADASLVISLQGSEEDGPTAGRRPEPNVAREAWPEPPKPLIATANAAKAEDRKYMPKEQEQSL